MPSVASISQQIWDMKYRLKGPNGAALDKTIEDTWLRIATALAEPEQEAERAAWAGRFGEALEGFRFLPAGRVVAGAGSGRSVTLFNCFVMGEIPDDMSGIFTHLREAALTMQQGGGIGYDFSTLRPKGAPVKGVGADASGPLSFMDVWDAMCRTIMSAGYRRGAMMGTLRCDHPDVEAFIEAKREPGRLRMFNLSVLVTDGFMAAIKEDAPWELKFAGTTYKVLPARELWDKIMRATYAYAEPGVIFIDRINRRNNLHYCEEIHATNPCVTADTWVQTSEGPRQVEELIGDKFTAVVDGQARRSGPEGFFATGVRPVFRLTTREGYTLRLTGNHKVMTAASRARATVRREWRRADELKPGDLVVLNDHGASATWPGAYDGTDGMSRGHSVGRRFAGLLDQRQTFRAAAGWSGASGQFVLPPLPLAGPSTIAQEGWGEGQRRFTGARSDADVTSPHPALSRKRERVPGNSFDEKAKILAEDFALKSSGGICSELEETASSFYCGFLTGIFDEIGSFDTTQGRTRIALTGSQADAGALRVLQRMLLRLGIVSQIEHGTLTIAGPSALRFSGSVIAPMVNIRETDNRKQLLSALAGLYSGAERFLATVTAVEPDGEAAVFDVQVPGINAFDANGLYAHNCGEQPLPPYGACLLGSINLASLVRDPFEATARLDLEELARLVPLAVRMMDNVVDASRFPLEQQRLEAQAKRRIGLGVTGLADALILCGVRYGSAPAVALTESWLKAIQREAYLASAALAAEKGAFPLFDRDKYLAGETVRELDADVRAAIAAHGVRNALLTSIAPTGTISIFADNVSSGLEPVFSFRYTRNVLMPDGSRKEEEVTDYAYRLFHRLKGETTTLPDYFVDAQSLAPGDHLVMQAAVQKYIDSSISKTINLPADIAFDAFKDIYLQAYELGCKGCTTYRPNEITGAVLEVRKEAEAPAAIVALREPELPLAAPSPKHADIYEAGGVVYMTQPLSRPESLPGQTYKIKWPDGDHAMYITINDVIQDGRRRPFEIFINSKNMEHYAWTVGLTRMISAVFRRGGDVSFVVEEMKAVFDPRGGAWMGGKYVPSLLAAIGDVIEHHMIDTGFLPSRDTKEIPQRQVVNLPTSGTVAARMAQCPKCGEASLIRVEGCDQCTSCGYSKCG